MEVSTVISLGISILSIIFCIVTFVRNGNKDIKKETADEQYRQGQLDMQLKNILEKLNKIESKLDNYDKELDERITAKIEQHIQIYHKGV